MEYLNIQRQYPFGRKVSGKMSHVSLETLENDGLYRLMPELDDPVSNHDIGLRLRSLRDNLFSRPTAASSDEPEIVINLGLNFRSCGFARTFAFLSLRARRDLSCSIEDLVKPRVRSHRMGAFVDATGHIREEPSELQKGTQHPFAHSRIIHSDEQ